MKILLIEDNETLNTLIKRNLEKLYTVVSFTDPLLAMDYNDESPADVVLSDIMMPGMTGTQVLARVRTAHPDTYVILFTGHASVEDSVKAIKNGAFDYMVKPIDMNVLRSKLQLISEYLGMKYSVQQAAEQYRPVYRSEAMKKLIAIANRVAETDASVLITGETGCGKEVLARYIHEASKRKSKPFMAVNCPNLPENLFESELFGYKRGAFTGADRNKRGIISTADGGTLFLDEIGEMPVMMQPKFLRFLETNQFIPLGSETPEKSNVRTIAATNRNMDEQVASRAFREDLYYRLNTITLHIPPLRERAEDISPLTAFFIERFRTINPGIKGISSEGVKELAGYPFPGNIRELSNIIERAMILETESEITPASLSLNCTKQPNGHGKLETLDSVIRAHILKTLDQCGWDKKKASEILNVDRTTIYRKLKEYGINTG